MGVFEHSICPINIQYIYFLNVFVCLFVCFKVMYQLKKKQFKSHCINKMHRNIFN